MGSGTDCPVQTAVEVMGGKWKPGILFRLAEATYRFSELKRSMPWISEGVLIRQLKELERDGVIRRTDHHEVPPRVDYGLTPYGETLKPLLNTMAQWGQTHIDRRAR